MESTRLGECYTCVSYGAWHERLVRVQVQRRRSRLSDAKESPSRIGLRRGGTAGGRRNPARRGCRRRIGPDVLRGRGAVIRIRAARKAVNARNLR